MSWYNRPGSVTATFNLEQPAAITESSSGGYVAEASDQNLRPGEWPQTVSFKTDSGHHVFQLNKFDRHGGDIAGAHYVGVNNPHTLLIIND